MAKTKSRWRCKSGMVVVPLAAAIRYALSSMPKARAYLSDGWLEFGNNICERSIRPIALGRKNYLFMGALGGGKAAAIAYTLIETAKMNGVDPQLGSIVDLQPNVTVILGYR